MVLCVFFFSQADLHIFFFLRYRRSKRKIFGILQERR
jgi:hypothetical protein